MVDSNRRSPGYRNVISSGKGSESRTAHLGEIAQAVKEAPRILHMLYNFHSTDDIELLAFFDEILGGAMSIFERVSAG